MPTPAFDAGRGGYHVGSFEPEVAPLTSSPVAGRDYIARISALRLVGAAILLATLLAFGVARDGALAGFAPADNPGQASVGAPTSTSDVIAQQGPAVPLPGAQTLFELEGTVANLAGTLLSGA